MEIDKKKAAKGVLSVVSGWHMAKQAAGAFVEIGTAAKRVGNLAKGVFKRSKASRVKETFSEAVDRLNLTETDLRTREEEFQFRAALGFMTFVAGFAFFVFFPMVTHQLSHFLMSLGVMMVGAASWLSWRFRTSQVMNRELFAFGSWLRRDVWVRRVVLVVGAVVGILLTLYATSAKAEGISLGAFSPTPGDATVSFLREIYGSVIDQIASGGNSTQLIDSALGRMFATFNTAVLFLAMVFVAYTTITGTINSAHEGAILGRKMSEIWVPIRTVLGTAFLLPLSSGYCLIQIGVLWCILQGVGIGNSTLNAFLDFVAETNMVSRPNLPDTRQLAAGILKSEVCAAAMNKQYTDSGWTRRVITEEKTWIVANTGEIGIGNAVATGALASVPVAGTALTLGYLAHTAANISYRVTEFHWREVDGDRPVSLNPDICGALTWHQSEESANGNSNTMIAKRQIMLAHQEAVRQMILDLRPLALQIAEFRGGLTPGAIEAAAARYENTLVQAARLAVQETQDARRSEFIDAARAGGWIYISIYYNKLIQLNDVMQSALNSLPANSPITVEGRTTNDVLQNYRDALSVADEYLKAKVEAPRQEMRRQFKQDGEFPTSWGDLKRLLSGFAQVGIYELTQQLAGSNLSHVGQIKAVGDVIMGSAETLATMTFMASGAANSNLAKMTVGNVFDAGSALASINPIIMTICLSLLIFGAIAAYYIPLIPFIIGITAIIKFFVAGLEAVIAAPLWAAAHVHPDGDDAVGRGGAGYMLILGLMMRPALTVLGFCASILLAQPITGFINIGYMTAVQGAESNSFSFIAAFVAYTIIYVVIMTGVIHSVFALVNIIPDQVPRWIGSHMGGTPIADHEQEKAGGEFKGAVAVMTRGGHGGVPKTPKGNGEAPTTPPPKADKGSANAVHMPEPPSN